MSALVQFENALRAHGAKGGRGMWTCPGHEDRSPSLSVKAGDDGRVLLRCHAGCGTADVVAALGLRLADLFDGPRPASWTPPPRSPSGLSWAPPRAHRGRMGLPTDDDLFWSQPDEVIDAHFAALPAGPSDDELRAFVDRRHAGEVARVV